MVLENLGKSLHNALKRLIGATVVDEELVKEIVRDIQRALLQADVAVELVLKVTEVVEQKALREELPPGISRREHVVKVVYDQLASVLGGKTDTLQLRKGKTAILMMVGIQGSGKTTQSIKLARWHQKRGIKTAVVCADTFRPGAYDQLLQLSKRAGVPFFGDPKASKPDKIAREGIEKFQKERFDFIIVDTAGRHKEERGLIAEMKKISKTINPDEIILVIDGTLGQQASAQAIAFHDATKIGSIIVTKLDGSARGGGALSAAAATGAPIKFIGVGEGIEDIEEFNPTRFVGRLLGLGDLKSLIEKVKEAQVAPSKDMVTRFMTGKFDLSDFYEQMVNLRKMGPLQKVLSMMGVGYQVPDSMKEMAEEKLEQYKVIIQSMTAEEKAEPKLINASRAQRIGRGSGTSAKNVRELIKQYNASKKMVKQIRKRRIGLGRGRGGVQVPALKGRRIRR